MSILEDRLKAKIAYEREVENEVAIGKYTPEESEKEIIDEIIEKVSLKFRDRIATEGADIIEEQIRKAVNEECAKSKLDYKKQKAIEKSIIDNIIGLGPIERFMQDKEITEILVLRYNQIYIEKNGKVVQTNAKFSSEEHLNTVINKIVQRVGRQINLQRPIVDARLKDGSRVCATIPPVSVDGSTLSIRKFSNKALTPKDYLNLKTVSEPMLKFLLKCVRGKMNILISGGTNSGKTTLLNMLSSAIPDNEMIITIEDSCELKLNIPGIRRLEARDEALSNGTVMPITIRALVKASLRMRPDRIIVGEVRDNAFEDVVSAMATGHEGSMCTAHANSPQALIDVRIPQFYAMGNSGYSEKSQKLQVGEALDLIVQIARDKQGIRHITNVTDVNLVDGDIRLNDIFTYSEKEGFKRTDYYPKAIVDKLALYDISVDRELRKESQGSDRE